MASRLTPSNGGTLVLPQGVGGRTSAVRVRRRRREGTGARQPTERGMPQGARLTTLFERQRSTDVTAIDVVRCERPRQTSLLLMLGHRDLQAC